MSKNDSKSVKVLIHRMSLRFIFVKNTDMRKPIEMFRVEIKKDIEKYSSQGDSNLLKVLNDYLELIDEIYLDDESKLMVHSFFQGVRYSRENRMIKSTFRYFGR